MSAIEIRIGALADPLLTQITSQGFHAPACDIEHWQRDADAISRLSVKGYITGKQASVASGKLVKRIARGVKAVVSLTKEAGQ